MDALEGKKFPSAYTRPNEILDRKVEELGNRITALAESLGVSAGLLAQGIGELNITDANFTLQYAHACRREDWENGVRREGVGTIPARAINVGERALSGAIHDVVSANPVPSPAPRIELVPMETHAHIAA